MTIVIIAMGVGLALLVAIVATRRAGRAGTAPANANSSDTGHLSDGGASTSDASCGDMGSDAVGCEGGGDGGGSD